jgi:hypothetical protein
MYHNNYKNTRNRSSYSYGSDARKDSSYIYRSNSGAYLHNFIMEYINHGKANFNDERAIACIQSNVILEESTSQRNTLHDIIHLLVKDTREKRLNWKEASSRCYTLLEFIFKYAKPVDIYTLMKKQDKNGYHPVSYLFCLEEKCTELYFNYINDNFSTNETGHTLISDMFFNRYEDGSLRLFLCSATWAEDIERYFNAITFCYNNGLLTKNDLEHLYCNISNIFSKHSHFITKTLSLLTSLKERYQLEIDYSAAFESNVQAYHFLHAILAHIYKQNQNKKPMMIGNPKTMNDDLFIKDTLEKCLFNQNTPADFIRKTLLQRTRNGQTVLTFCTNIHVKYLQIVLELMKMAFDKKIIDKQDIDALIAQKNDLGQTLTCLLDSTFKKDKQTLLNHFLEEINLDADHEKIISAEDAPEPLSSLTKLTMFAVVPSESVDKQEIQEESSNEPEIPSIHLDFALSVK